jgi:hypothetical protein
MFKRIMKIFRVSTACLQNSVVDGDQLVKRIVLDLSLLCSDQDVIKSDNQVVF